MARALRSTPLHAVENAPEPATRVRVLTEDATMAGVLLRDGRFEIVGTLGEGAQATTFEGVDHTTGRRVAIKQFRVRGARSWKDVELAEREASVLAELSHPALPVHVDHFEENGALYLVMERIEGETLAALGRRTGALSRGDVLRFLHDAASVLDYLHGRSPPVIHRDINPKNVLRRPDGSFALVDFGAVRAALKPRGGSTVVGTFGYMAPEQFQGRALPASDVYSVGATALTLLTNVEPEELPHRGLAIDVGAALTGTVAPELRPVLERMLEPDPDRRASRVQPLLDELSRRSERPRAASARVDPRSRTRPDDSWADWERDAHAQWQTRRDARHARRRAAHEWRATRTHVRRHRRGLHGPPLVIAMLALHAALLVVAVTLGVVIPVALTMLSLFFGPALRRAAEDARRAEVSARTALLRVRHFLLYGPEPATAGTARVHAEPSPAQQEPRRQRVAVSDDELADSDEDDREASRSRREHRA